VKLTTSLPSLSGLSRKHGLLTSHKPICFHDLLHG
jgi:hypothetical protein